MKTIRSLFYWIRTLSIFLCTGLLYICVSLFLSPQRIHPYARRICRILLWSAGQKIEVHGEWPVLQTPRIYMFNHSSLLDTFVCIATIPEHTATIGKKEQFRIPIWGKILHHWGCIALDRYHPQRAIEQMQALQQHFAGDKAVLVAPEGTRSPTGTLLPFKKGPFYLAEACHASIIPIRIQGAFESKNKRSWHIRSGVIDVYIGEIVPPSSREIMRKQTHDALHADILVDHSSVDSSKSTSSNSSSQS